MDKNKLATRLSAALNAPLITLITFIPLILLNGLSQAPLLILITSVFGCILPLAMVYGLLKLDIIQDFYAHDRDTRFIPFIWTTLFYLLGTISLILVSAPQVVTALMACYFVNGLVLMVITLKWKISIHASGVAGPFTALVYQLGVVMLPLLLVIIPVAWARVELKAHTIMQVVVGAVLSCIMTWLQMGFYLHHLII
ncbi:MAG: PAP2 family protein [Candidatus Bathyarchaeia archaeon]